MSSSSAAATPARTASAPRTARARFGHPDRDHARPAREGEQAAGLAELADEDAHLLVAGRRRDARLRRRDDPLRRRERQGQEAALRPRRRQVPADPRHRVRAQGRSRAARHGLRRPGAGRHGQGLGVELDKRGNVLADTVKYKTSKEKVFSCGDMRRGQSLVVWAIREGRQCAARAGSRSGTAYRCWRAARSPAACP
jgi:hypothetical protein